VLTCDSNKLTLFGECFVKASNVVWKRDGCRGVLGIWNKRLERSILPFEGKVTFQILLFEPTDSKSLGFQTLFLRLRSKTSRLNNALAHSRVHIPCTGNYFLAHTNIR
jgi:hypothetical protein